MLTKKGALLLSFLTFVFFMSISSTLVFAAEVAQAAALPIGDAVGQIWGLYLQHKGSTMGIIFVAVQGLMLLTKTDLLSFVKGKTKLIAVAALTFLGAVIANLVQGGDVISILGDATVMTSLQVLLHQVIKPKKA